MQARQIDPDNRHDRKTFFRFPFDLFRANPYWTPPLQTETNLVFDRKKHPFYRHSKADFFLVENQARVVARFALLHNRLYCDFHKEETGFIAYLDFIEDREVVDCIVETARAWARKNTLASFIGPRGLLRSNGFGILVEGFEFSPAFGIPYNHSYYGPLMEAAGFIKISDLFSGYLEPTYQIPEKVIFAVEKIKQHQGFKIIHANRKKDLKPWIDQIGTIYENAFIENPNYYPSTREEFALMVKSIYQVADPRLVKIILKDDQIAGFVLCYPNITAAVRRVAGKLWPFGWIDILRELRTTTRIDANGIGLLPEHQGRGANILLYAELEKSLREYGATFCEFIQADERNVSKSDMDSMGVIWHKRHRLYRLPV